MDCTSAVFLLMGGAAALAFAAMYFYGLNKTNELKRKVNLYNTALTQLQNEKSNLVVKTEDMYSENASQNVYLAHLKEENRLIQGRLELMEMNNEKLKEEYKKLAEWLFENRIK